MALDVLPGDAPEDVGEAAVVAFLVRDEIRRLALHFERGEARRSAPPAVINAFAPASASRVAIAGAAKPEKMGTWIAPRCAHACEAIATSGDIGRKIPTAPPRPIPSAASASARRGLSRES